MPRIAKGKRPVFLANPQTDQLFAIIVALMEEVSVLHDRLDALERLAESKGLILQQEIDHYEPEGEVAQARSQWRDEYIARVLRVLHEDQE